MIQAECKVIPAPEISDEEIRALSKGWVVYTDIRGLRAGDAFRLVYEGVPFWTMCRMDLYRVSLRRMSEKEVQYSTDHGHPLGGGKVRRVETPYVRESDGVTVYIDIPTCGLKTSEALAEIERLKAAHPDESIETDQGIDENGVFRLIVGRRRDA